MARTSLTLDVELPESMPAFELVATSSSTINKIAHNGPAFEEGPATLCKMVYGNDKDLDSSGRLEVRDKARYDRKRKEESERRSNDRGILLLEQIRKI
ncbi:hypothetical protein E4U32_001775 [Claviceps aff. humidiphila group G2b]|nr:hypothetical protein E4U32_001775 [Claviceps aff. humidiphila group G2b]